MRQNRYDVGLCMRCGEAPFVPGIQVCKQCQAKAADDSRQRRERNKILGVCNRCCKPMTGKAKTLCATCIEETKTVMRNKQTIAPPDKVALGTIRGMMDVEENNTPFDEILLLCRKAVGLK